MREKLIELLNNSFDEQYSKRGLLTVPHIADHLIANGVTFDKDNNVPSKWIPVTEMVPESHVEPIEDFDGIHYVVISDFVLGNTDEGECVVVRHEVGDERDLWVDYCGGLYTITHWMKLPEKPKEETK